MSFEYYSKLLFATVFTSGIIDRLPYYHIGNLDYPIEISWGKVSY